ncbi:cytochrome b [Labrys miyagiensis]|uniref:Cytochrome b n=1 Tax=Labrys miyagiensis TaxID=346912 RepID=A0ABQ6CID6_9HYPH|nr:cytochrome b/b6 domain-containing protein [Labrys miyagiensis]GLS19996.1 cytochrome b [Labrys miyagiensis]
MSSTATPTAPDRYHYDRQQRLFHWLMAAIIFTAIGLGVWAAFLEPGTSPRREILDIHKSLGMTALVLVVLRLVYRLLAGEPLYRNAPPALTHLAARLAHLALYGLMFFMPLTGYLFSASGNYSLPWFGLFSWPRLLPLDKARALLGESLHYWGAWAIGAVLTLHVLAVAWHVLVRKDEVLERMLPGK